MSLELLMMPRAADAAAPGTAGMVCGGGGTGSAAGGMPAGWRAGFTAVLAQLLAALAGSDREDPEGLDTGAEEGAWAGLGSGPEQAWPAPRTDAGPVLDGHGPFGQTAGLSVPGDGDAVVMARTQTAAVAGGVVRGDSPLIGDSPQGQTAAPHVWPMAGNARAAQTLTQTLTQTPVPGVEQARIAQARGQAPSQGQAQTVSPGAQMPTPVMAAEQPQTQGRAGARTLAPVPMQMTVGEPQSQTTRLVPTLADSGGSTEMSADKPLPQVGRLAQAPVSEPRGAAVMPGAVVPGEGGGIHVPRGDSPPDEAAPQPGATASRVETPLMFATGAEVREAAAAEPRSPAPLPMPAVQESIARQVVYRVLGELEQLRGQAGRVVRLELQLHPPELGRVVVRLIWQTAGLEARFLTGDQTVRGAIEQALPQLREALGRQDVNLLEVSADLAREQDGEPMRREPRGSRLIRYETAHEEADDAARRQPERTTAWVINRLA